MVYDVLAKKGTVEILKGKSGLYSYGSYKGNGQRMHWEIVQIARGYSLIVRLNGDEFYMVFYGDDALKEAESELLSTYRRIEGASEWFREWR